MGGGTLPEVSNKEVTRMIYEDITCNKGVMYGSRQLTVYEYSTVQFQEKET